MALITGFGLFIASVLTAALSKVVVEECVAWAPWIVRRFIKIAVARLPENHRERFAEEWQSHVDEVPGVVAKIFMAADFLRAAHRMALSGEHSLVCENWLQDLERIGAACLEPSSCLAQFETIVS